MRILITGAPGQVGFELMHALRQGHEVIGMGRDRMDLRDSQAVRRAIRDIRPDVIVNAAAYTAVDQAESDRETAHQVNAVAVGVMGEEARRIGAAVIHYSTDYVFDGRKTTPYSPTDAPNPQNVYGQTKLEGEEMLMTSQAAAVILRTSWVYGLRGKNFLMSVLRQAATKTELRIVNDQTGSPTWCREIARATGAIIHNALTGGPGGWSFGGREGVYHLTARGCTTWLNFAHCAFELLAARPAPRLIPIATGELGAAARRPEYSVLDCSETEKTFNVLMAGWRAALEEVMHNGELSVVLNSFSPREPSNESLQPPAPP